VETANQGNLSNVQTKPFTPSPIRDATAQGIVASDLRIDYSVHGLRNMPESKLEPMFEGQ
jgi:hypothetical protein